MQRKILILSDTLAWLTEKECGAAWVPLPIMEHLCIEDEIDVFVLATPSHYNQGILPHCYLWERKQVFSNHLSVLFDGMSNLVGYLSHDNKRQYYAYGLRNDSWLNDCFKNLSTSQVKIKKIYWFPTHFSEFVKGRAQNFQEEDIILWVYPSLDKNVKCWVSDPHHLIFSRDLGDLNEGESLIHHLCATLWYLKRQYPEKKICIFFPPLLSSVMKRLQESLHEIDLSLYEDEKFNTDCFESYFLSTLPTKKVKTPYFYMHSFAEYVLVAYRRHKFFRKIQSAIIVFSAIMSSYMSLQCLQLKHHKDEIMLSIHEIQSNLRESDFGIPWNLIASYSSLKIQQQNYYEILSRLAHTTKKYAHVQKVVWDHERPQNTMLKPDSPKVLITLIFNPREEGKKILHAELQQEFPTATIVWNNEKQTQDSPIRWERNKQTEERTKEELSLVLNRAPRTKE